MLDFLKISTSRNLKPGTVVIYPIFIINGNIKDLLIRNHDFYSVWDEETGKWYKREEVALRLIDKELDTFAEEYKKKCEDPVCVLHTLDAETGMIDRWHKYVRRQMRDSYIPGNEYSTCSSTFIKNPSINKTYYSLEYYNG